jgi:hypothetical protein
MVRRREALPAVFVAAIVLVVCLSLYGLAYFWLAKVLQDGRLGVPALETYLQLVDALS